ncbi:hypothetical protein TIFTF001_004635 [Ficus carica]|uniref:Uncharacterized protein n=1 Tax=Ficus carica TaxID=3494 RepID=A0AA87ZGW0_FICCA|nr:hypothetical protein TIFTF001_004635 [Ficus carica]
MGQFLKCANSGGLCLSHRPSPQGLPNNPFDKSFQTLLSLSVLGEGNLGGQMFSLW